MDFGEYEESWKNIKWKIDFSKNFPFLFIFPLSHTFIADYSKTYKKEGISQSRVNADKSLFPLVSSSFH